MKSKIKVTIGNAIYEIESGYENGIETIVLKCLPEIIKQHNLIITK